jgi:hypothetical protein
MRNADSVFDKGTISFTNYQYCKLALFKGDVTGIGCSPVLDISNATLLAHDRIVCEFKHGIPDGLPEITKVLDCRGYENGLCGMICG